MLCCMAARHDQLSAGTAEFVSAALRYWLGVYPRVRHDVDHWLRRARMIASPGLRSLALQNLDGERTNLEGAAAFATFVARRYRPRVIRAQVAFQAAYDYADSLSETPSGNRVINAHQLHGALLVAVAGPRAHHDDYYEYHDECDDGGYLVTLVDTARTNLLSLPSYNTVSQALRDGASRIVRYQSLIGEPRQLATWVRSAMAPDSLLAWWETAAACGSSMGVFALMASAARPAVRPCELARIERAYFPWIGALHTLLDSLIDWPDDQAAGRQSLVDYYRSVPMMVERLTLLAVEARQRAQALPHGSDHTMILTGMVSSYLSSTQAALPPARLARVHLSNTMGLFAWPTLAIFHVRRLVTRAQLYRR